MKTQTVMPPEVLLAPARWAMATDERGDGFVMATAVGRELHVHVGDPAAPSHPARHRSGGLVTAVLDDAGSAAVETTTAPPALLVARDGLRLLPAEPHQDRRSQLDIGDRLVLCSASGPDDPPDGLLAVLRSSAEELLNMSPSRLLDVILEGVDHGAAAVVSRFQPAPPEAHRREDRI